MSESNNEAYRWWDCVPKPLPNALSTGYLIQLAAWGNQGDHTMSDKQIMHDMSQEISEQARILTNQGRQIERLRTENQRLRAACQRASQSTHHPSCPASKGDSIKCSCHVSVARDAITKVGD